VDDAADETDEDGTSPFAKPLLDYVYAMSERGLAPELRTALLCAYCGAEAAETMRAIGHSPDSPEAVPFFTAVVLEYIETFMNYPEHVLTTVDDVLIRRLPSDDLPDEPSAFWPPDL
jgi:hypothetical protein